MASLRGREKHFVRAAKYYFNPKKLLALSQTEAEIHLDDLPEPNAAELPGEPPLQADSAWVARLMQQLPPGYRTVLNLYAIEGYNHEEIAGLLGISAGTSKSQLSKARTIEGLAEKMSKIISTLTENAAPDLH